MTPTTSVSGTCDSAFGSVRDALGVNLESGEELGASIAINLDGQTVVDVWGGWRDQERTQPWEPDTIVNVWSSTKTVTSLAIMMLVSRGQLDVHAPVARYWPEFAAAGKEHVEVRHVLSHTSGVSGLDQPAAVEDLYDWNTSTARMAAQAPWWEPGTASGYHALNYGHLLGEVLRRVTGRSLKQFVAEEIAGPLGADFQIGAAAVDTQRIAPVVPPPPLPFDLAAMDPTSPVVRTFTGPPVDANSANTPAWRAADIGAANGHGNARSVARMLSAVTLDGRVDGHQLLSADAISLIFEQQSDGVDLVLGLPLRFGIGYGLPQPVSIPYIPTGRVCFWGGWGGSLIVMDLDRRLTFAYMMNSMAPGIVGSTRAEAYMRAAVCRAQRATSGGGNGLVAAAAQGSAGQGGGVDSAVDHGVPLTKTYSMPTGELLGVGARGGRADRARVENHDVGDEAVAQQAAVAQTQPLRGKRRHLADRLRQAQHALVARELAQDDREAAVGARTRELAQQHRVAADHRQRVRDELGQVRGVARKRGVRGLQVLVQQQVAQRVDRVLAAHQRHLLDRATLVEVVGAVA